MEIIHSLSWSQGSFSQGHLRGKKQRCERYFSSNPPSKRGNQNAIIMPFKVKETKMKYDCVPCFSSPSSSCRRSCSRKKKMDENDSKLMFLHDISSTHCSSRSPVPSQEHLGVEGRPPPRGTAHLPHLQIAFSHPR